MIRFRTSHVSSLRVNWIRDRPCHRRKRHEVLRTARKLPRFCASLSWLIDRRPDLRNELTYGLVNVLIFKKGDFDEATQVLSAAVGTAELEALARLASLASRVGDLSLQKAIMDRGVELAASQARSPSTVEAPCDPRGESTLQRRRVVCPERFGSAGPLSGPRRADRADSPERDARIADLEHEPEFVGPL